MKKGVEYELSVMRYPLPNPTADDSSFTYKLERIIGYKVLFANMTGIEEA